MIINSISPRLIEQTELREFGALDIYQKASKCKAFDSQSTDHVFTMAVQTLCA